MIVYDAPMSDTCTTAPSGHQYYDANVPSMLPMLVERQHAVIVIGPLNCVSDE